MLTVGKPIQNLHFVLFIVSSRPSSRLRKRRDLLEALESVTGGHHDPHAVIGDQLREP